MSKPSLSGLIASAALGVAALLGAAAPAAAADHPAGVRIEMTDEMGPVLADPRGRTLYTYRGDRKAGESSCNDVKLTHANGAGSMSYELPEPHLRPTCAQIWPPFLAAADAQPVGDWTLVNRAGGGKQWAFQGKPLYTFVQDSQPGEINGLDGASGRVLSGRTPAWAPMDMPRGVIANNTSVGRILMTERGKVLYFKAGGITKASANLAAWKPLSAPAIAEAPKGWSFVTLPDGGRQWTFQGRPVYTYSGDAVFGDLNGLEEAGWQAATLQKPLAPPPELKVVTTADGEAFADSKGMTLYSWGCSDETPDRALCDIPGATQTYRLSICGKPETCIKTWRPVVASPNAKPVGRTWSIVAVDPTGANQYAAPGQKDALRVWAYRGRPVYTFAGDKRPGDMQGHNVTSGFAWGYGMVRADADERRGF